MASSSRGMRVNHGTRRICRSSDQRPGADSERHGGVRRERLPVPLAGRRQDLESLDSPSAEDSVSAVRAQEAGNQLVVASATEGLFVMDMGSASSASADSAEPSLAPR